MSYELDIANGVDFIVCPVDGITIFTDPNGVTLSRDEALALASAIIGAYNGYIGTQDPDSGNQGAPITHDELQRVMSGEYYSNYHQKNG